MYEIANDGQIEHNEKSTSKNKNNISTRNFYHNIQRIPTHTISKQSPSVSVRVQPTRGLKTPVILLAVSKNDKK